MSIMIREKLIHTLEQNGYKGQIIDVSHLDKVKDRFQTLHNDGVFNSQFYKKELSEFEFNILKEQSWIKSFIIVAVFQPIFELTVNWADKEFSAIIPPQYLATTDEDIENLISPFLKENGYRMRLINLPLKHLAVRSGLAKYGRNNIAYVPGMGSFLRLVAYGSDLPAEKDAWGDEQLMDRCHNCTACQKLCPTAALDTDRFLLHAERCLTYHNESDDDFPDWIDPAWHHCLIGCMRCQEVCPENRAFKKKIENLATFSESETAAILDSAWDELSKSVGGQSIDDLVIIRNRKSLLPRNLRMLLELED